MTKRQPRQFKKTPKSLRGYGGWQNASSIFFVLWAIFGVLSLALVLFSVFTQQMILSQSYKEQVARELTDKGQRIETEIFKGAPEWAGGNYSGYIRKLSQDYNVTIRILNEEGDLLFPREPNFDVTSPEVEETLDFSKEIARLKEQLVGNVYTVYEMKGGYAYAAQINLFPDAETYLYVVKPIALSPEINSVMNVRILLVSLFMFLLSFAVTSAVAGWFTNPITEMTQKAHRLAQGDFDVDFQGGNYGKEMVELAEALNYARDELSKTDRMQKELIANVSHDFKTPLTMIKGYASMIIEISGDNPEKRNKHAQIIVDEADRLAELVGDVLDLSKIQAGIAQLEMTEIDMSVYLGEVMDRFAYLKETQGYQFTVEAEEGLYTTADEVKIGQVLYNLIGNAVNYTGEDKQVFVSLKREGDTFRFAVRDTGKGLKDEEINGIWDRYYRSTDSHKRPVQGTGLGLSIVKTILQRHGFLYGVESEVGKGSTFYVIFPSSK